VVPHYVRHLPGAKRFRLALTQCENWEELDNLLEMFFNTEYAPEKGDSPPCRACAHQQAAPEVENAQFCRVCAQKEYGTCV
jgi:hypothetical protein